MAIFGSNPNKGYAQQGSITGGYENTYKVNPGSIGGVNIYKTKNGTRGLHGMGSTYYEKEAGSGKFYKSSGRDWVQVEDYNPNPEPEAKPESSGGGSSSGGSSGSSGSYPSNPSAGNTGYASVDANSLAMMRMIEALTDSISALGDMEDDFDSVSNGSGEGLASTVLTGNVYVPQSEKKKKSYLTPMAVG
jgi:hypothetical protein